MNKPERKDFPNDVAFAVAFVQWRRWFLTQPKSEDTND